MTITDFEKVKSEQKLQNALTVFEFLDRVIAGRIQKVIQQNQILTNLIESSLSR